MDEGIVHYTLCVAFQAVRGNRGTLISAENP